MGVEPGAIFAGCMEKKEFRCQSVRRDLGGAQKQDALFQCGTNVNAIWSGCDHRLNMDSRVTTQSAEKNPHTSASSCFKRSAS